MVKLIDPLMSQEAHGKVGGIVYRQYHATAIASAKAAPLSTHGKSKNDRLRHMPDAMRQWRELPEYKRSNWMKWADAHAYTSRMGHRHHIHGVHWHRAAFIVMALAQMHCLGDAPTTPCLTRLQRIFLSQEGYWIRIDYDYSGDSTIWVNWIEVYLAGPHSPGRRPRIKDARRAGHSILDSTYLVPIYTLPGTYTVWARTVDHQGVTSMFLTATIRMEL